MTSNVASIPPVPVPTGYEPLTEPTVEPVEIPGMKPFFVRELTVEDASAIRNNENREASIIYASCVDDNGNRIFSYEKACRFRMKFMAPVMAAYARLNGVDEEAVQDAEKN